MQHPVEHFCRQGAECPDSGVRGKGNLSFRGWSGTGKRIRMIHCRTCGAHFPERKGTVLSQSRLPEEKAVSLLEHVREGFGTAALLKAMLERSTASSTVNTSFVERNNGTDRGQNSRNTRKAYCFSHDCQVRPSGSYRTWKEWGVRNAAGYFIGLSYNFCWPVRTLDVKGADDRIEKRTPAMAAGLADHVWTTGEWIAFPARPP